MMQSCLLCNKPLLSTRPLGKLVNTSGSGSSFSSDSASMDSESDGSGDGDLEMVNVGECSNNSQPGVFISPIISQMSKCCND